MNYDTAVSKIMIPSFALSYIAADVLAENADLTYKCLSTEDFEFLETFILYQSS
jgi:hypothetical protein